jgi:hypothetical protein
VSDPTPAAPLAPPPPPMPLAYRPADLAAALHVSVQMINKHLASGTFRAVKLGDSTLILADHAREVLRSLPPAVYTTA